MPNPGIPTLKHMKKCVFGVFLIRSYILPSPQRDWAVSFLGYPTPTVSSRHTPSTKPNSAPYCGNLGPVLRGNKLIPLEHQLRGCCYQIFEIMVSTTQNLQIAFQKKLIKQEKEFLCVSFCVPFLHTNDTSYCFKMIITQHVVPAARSDVNLTTLFL